MLSLAAFAVPLASATVFDAGLLPWIAALIPAFLLSYYKGWIGSAAALAAGMAVIPAWVLVLWWLGRPEPSWDRVLVLVGVYLAFCVGLGVVTELLHRDRRTAELTALTDSLTGLPNRRHVEVFLSAAVSAARASGSPLSVLLLDVDRFGWLVDTHGREAGEEVMKAVAKLVRESAQPDWLSARAGDDELLVVMPQAARSDATRFGESLRVGIERLNIRWQPLTVSIGIASLGGPVKDAEQLLGAAESAVRAAKTAGRDRVQAASGLSAGGRTEPVSEGRPTTPRGLVALPSPAAESVQRVLELNGLGVERHGAAAELSAARDGEGRPAIVVTAASGRPELGDVLWELDRALDPSVPRVIFLEDLGEHEPTPRVVGATILRGAPSGDRLLPLLGSLLATGDKPQGFNASVDGGFASKLVEGDVPLTVGRIMVVDDEAHTSAALRRALEGIGFRDVVLVDNGQAALAAVIDTPPDLMILDLHMPGMDGFAVLEALRPLLEGDGFLPVLMVTGDQHWEHRQRALRIGAKDFLNKPFDVAELGARVLNLLETRRLHLQMRDSNALLEVRVRERTRQLGLAKDEILFRLARAAEYRDDVTGRHAERVGVAAAILGEAMGLPSAVCDMLRRSAPLHDVGKIGIPDSILMKPGLLTDAERQVMRRHTTIGADLLANSTSDVIEDARVIALTHHERWDGGGYPNGLAGDRIPLHGRLVALADALDALTHERPYKRPIPFDEATRRLIADSGTAFDPAVVEALRATAFRIRDVVLDEAHVEPPPRGP